MLRVTVSAQLGPESYLLGQRLLIVALDTWTLGDLRSYNTVSNYYKRDIGPFSSTHFLEYHQTCT